MTMQTEVQFSNFWIIIDGMNGVEIFNGDHLTVMDAINEYGGFQKIDDIDLKAGFCGRLSMSGFMDCTEWTGPFKTEQEAAETVETMFEDS